MRGMAPDEALEDAARLARQQAPALCRRDAATGDSCAWRHGLWPTLRLLGMVTAPALHAEFLRAALRGIAGERPRVLLSGAADHALLAQVLAAFGARRPAVTVLDICDTPLLLNRWYAERAGASVATRRSNILDFEEQEPFDAVCAHAFLGDFDTAQRAALAAKWRALLRPGGKVVTVNRLRPGHEAQWIAFSVEQVWAYRARVEEAAQARALQFPRLGKAAERYASRQTLFPLGSAAELRALFEGAGFDIEQLSAAPLPAAVQDEVAYALLVAVRR